MPERRIQPADSGTSLGVPTDLAGKIWFQGWNDGVGSGNPDYTKQLVALIHDVRTEFDKPNLPVVIGELGTDGPNAEGWIATFRAQQEAAATQPEFKHNVRLAKTAKFWPNPPDLSDQWAEFRANARKNGTKSADDPTRINPGDYYYQNWVQRYKDQLKYTSDKRYHYLGSGKCYYQMGTAMGYAMVELVGSNSVERGFRYAARGRASKGGRSPQTQHRRR